jgi:cytochrome c biogenesis protein CcdA
MTMAERRHDYEPHAETWHGFIRGSIAVILACVYVLVGLVSIGFGSTLPLFLGFLGIIAGVVAIAIDLRTGSRSWGLSLGVLAVFALITVINIY